MNLDMFTEYVSWTRTTALLFFYIYGRAVAIKSLRDLRFVHTGSGVAWCRAVPYLRNVTQYAARRRTTKANGTAQIVNVDKFAYALQVSVLKVK